jgi:hypothetical protein
MVRIDFVTEENDGVAQPIHEEDEQRHDRRHEDTNPQITPRLMQFPPPVHLE